MIYSIEEYKKEKEQILINNFMQSQDRRQLLDLKAYAKGNNPFISARTKKIYNEEAGGLINNPYAPNYKSKYNFYDQIISQKNNALCAEVPLIDDIEDKTRKLMGFATKKAGYIASMQGYSFTFVGVNNQFVVFDTENVLAFADESGKLKVLLRFWQSTIENRTVTYYERYNEKGMQRFKYGAGIKGVVSVTDLIPYKVNVLRSAVNTEYLTEEIGELPIIVCKNNDNLEPDMTPAIKSKIDLIDLIESDLYNNIQEFSDIWLSVSADVDIETAAKIKDSIRKSKTMVANDGTLDIKTIQIPHEARMTAINLLKQDLVEDAGIIDFKEIKGNATATEINARIFKLTQKVSDYEWYMDIYLTAVVAIWQVLNNKRFDINITFQKLFIKNNLEIVNIANSIADRVSKRAYLKLLQQANVIDDVDAEIEEQQTEALDKFELTDIESGVDYGGQGQGTQTDGYTANPVTETE